MLDALGQIEEHAKLQRYILFVCNILDLECNCGQCVGVEGGVIGKTG